MHRFLYLILLLFGTATAPAAPPVRTVVTTDGEIDDVDSFVRLLLYANEFELEGLVYSSSMWHYKGDGKGTTMTSKMEMTREMYGERTDLRWPGEQWMQALIGKYAEVYPVLSTHADGYPTAEHLLSLVKVGNIEFEGEMEHDTEGSDFIRDLLLDTTDVRPIYLQVWGGTNTIARALKSIEDTYAASAEWPMIYERVVKKAIIYTVMDQDATYRDYVAVKWPDIPVLYNYRQFAALAYPWQQTVPKPLHHWLEGGFMGDHIIKHHGPLTAAYYSYGDGQQQAGDEEHIHGDPTRLDSAQWGSFGQYDFISEGDSPAFLHLVDVGLQNLDHPSWGGWGGRLVATDSTLRRWEDGPAATDYNPYQQSRESIYAQIRWLPALQRDFAARADWCILSYEEANHPPSVEIDGETRLTVSPRQKITLRARATDPDGDELFYHWWQYGEVGTYPGDAMLILNKEEARVTVPGDIEPGQTIHLILEVTDGGSPSLTRYARVVLTGAGK
ncbi:DUF1593 domain-containing protein [Lewinella sp. JB7]|uniref:DUF1593 domain-containing protein n=1 Tax=Lewinella sp. JB7 TaxID=2962887 RepID=UPI0020CA07F8|nr:nucleoside hydrolase-like domain-containing protein [Lewinella sp. JB7]MCP9235907.1 DUF1593 domain-containing protein [Lewinella sp. JB7]